MGVFNDIDVLFGVIEEMVVINEVGGIYGIEKMILGLSFFGCLLVGEFWVNFIFCYGFV